MNIRAVASNRRVQTLFSLFVVFLVDLFAPLGIAVGALYVFCFFLICREDKRTICRFAFLASILTVTKLFIFFSADTSWVAYINRGISIVVIVTIAALAIRHRLLLEQRNAERQAYVKALEEMMFLTSHKMRQPVANCLGLLKLVDAKNPSQEDFGKIYTHLQTSALDLDKFTREVTAFITQNMGNRTEEILAREAMIAG